MSDQTPGAWSRGKLIAILATAAVAGLGLLVGLGLFIWQVLGTEQPPTQASEGASAGTPAVVMVDESTLAPAGPQRREQIADAPMLTVQDPLAYREGVVAATVTEPLAIPAATRTGALDVPTGYPHTPEGALAQLAAIDVAVISGMSVPATHEVYRAWSSGGADPADWVMTGNVTTFLTAAKQSGQTKEAGLVVTAAPAAAQIKGSDGNDWVLACVLLELRADLVEEAKAAYGHCEAMTWDQDRWLIDTTHPVSPAPSTWPGTELAAQAGWRPWPDEH